MKAIGNLSGLNIDDEEFFELLAPDAANEHEAILDGECALDSLLACRQDPQLSLLLGRRAARYEEQIQREINYLRNPRHTVALVGTIGVGKTLALCEVAGLVQDEKEERRSRHALPTGSGRTTLCEVRVQESDRLGLRVTPRPREVLTADVEDWAELLLNRERPCKIAEGDSGTKASTLSEEMQRALRNMAGLGRERGKQRAVQPLKEFVARYLDQSSLGSALLERLRLDQRTERSAWFEGESVTDGLAWLSKLVLDINNGKDERFPLPQIIDVLLPPEMFGLCGVEDPNDGLDMQLTLVDTKGIDQTSARADIESHLKDDRTMTVLCSRFNEAPQAELQALLRRAVDAGIEDVSERAAFLVLAHTGEPLAVRDDDGDSVESCDEGYEIRREQIEAHLRERGLPVVEATFYNAFEDTATYVRRYLIGRVRAMRARRVRSLSAAVRRAKEMLAKVEEGEYLRQAADFALRAREHIEGCHDLEDDQDFSGRDHLLQAILGARYPAWVRAAVRRDGAWDNFDFAHHFASGVRFYATRRVMATARPLKRQFRRLAEKPELELVSDFCVQLEDELDRHVAQVLDDAESTARDIVELAFSDAQDNLWCPASREWGRRGPGVEMPYKERIRKLTCAFFDEPEQVRMLHQIEERTERVWRKSVQRLLELVEVAG